MANKRKNIDNLFKDHLVGHKVSVPIGAWDRLEADLKPAKKHAVMFYVRLAAAAVFLLLAFGAGYFFSEFSLDSTNITASKTETNVTDQPVEEILTPPVEIQDISEDIKEGPQQETNHQIPLTEADRISQKPSGTKADISKKSPGHKNIAKEKQDVIKEGPPIEETVAVAVADEENQKEIQGTEETTAEVFDPTIDNDELEKMTPDELHKLLVGDNDFNDDIIAVDQSMGNSKWSVGGQLSPTYSYRNLSGEGFETPDEIVDQSHFNDTENGLTTLGGGISLAYNFNDRLSLGSGLFLSRIGQENNDVVAYDSPDSDYMYKLATSTGTVTINPAKFEKVMIQQIESPKDSIPGDYLVNGTFVQNLDYLEVPLVLRYKVLNKRFSINVSGGLSPGILVNNRSYFKIDDEKVQTGFTENIKPMIYNSVFGLGVAYEISKKVSVNLSPTFKYSLSPVNTGSGINYHPYSISWFTGISYKL
jgi:hypothetical protein